MDKNVIDHVLLGKGRMNRSQFAGVLFLLWIVEGILFMLAGAIFESNSSIMMYVSALLIISEILILTGILIRRGHDLGIPTFIGGITGITPLIGIFGVLLGQVLFKSIFMYILFLAIILALYCALYSLVLLILSGKKETNKYGQQPKDLKIISEIIRFWWTGKV